MSVGFIPEGSEFQVNTYTLQNQQKPSITTLSDGGFLITWQSFQQDGGMDDIYAQRYDAAGVAVGAEFKVNTYGADSQQKSSVTALNDGGFVVTWRSYGQDGSGGSVYGQRYDAMGNPAGAEFQVNTYVTNDQSRPSLTGLDDGGFVATWMSLGQDGTYYGIYGQRYDAAGNPTGVEFQINTFASTNQSRPSVTALDDGGFVVTWQSDDQDGDGYGIFGQRYDASGNPVGAEFQVNTYTTGSQSEVSITALNDGGFVVTWQSNGQDGESYGIYGQRYDSTGGAVGAEFRVNTDTVGDQRDPSVTALSDGGFVVIWQSESQNGYIYDVFGQRYDAAGEVVGGEFLINTYTTHDQSAASVSALPDGGFVVAWHSTGQDGSEKGIYAQQFKAQLFGTNDDNVMSDSVGANWMDGRHGDDTIYGLDGDDLIYGRLGNDLLVGGAGNDVLKGGGYHDELIGSSGNDRLLGGNGNDILRGGADQDQLFGGAGADQFVFSAVTDSDVGGGKLDRIRDFEVGVDVIDLSAFGLSYVGSGGFSGTGAEVSVTLNDAGGTTVSVDVDGDGLADMRIFVTGVTGLTVDDFWL